MIPPWRDDGHQNHPGTTPLAPNLQQPCSPEPVRSNASLASGGRSSRRGRSRSRVSTAPVVCQDRPPSSPSSPINNTGGNLQRTGPDHPASSFRPLSEPGDLSDQRSQSRGTRRGLCAAFHREMKDRSSQNKPQPYRASGLILPRKGLRIISAMAAKPGGPVPSSHSSPKPTPTYSPAGVSGQYPIFPGKWHRQGLTMPEPGPRRSPHGLSGGEAISAIRRWLSFWALWNQFFHPPTIPPGASRENVAFPHIFPTTTWGQWRVRGRSAFKPLRRLV